MIKAGESVKIEWTVKDGVSATLRGPLPGGNSELTLSPDPQADFKISAGSLQVRVISAMTYILQAEVKRPDNQPNVQVVRMLSLDTSNNKYLYVDPRPTRVLPYGLIEIDWAAWGVRQVQLSVGAHTTRTILLTQQTLGRFYEGSGVMRVNATREINEIRTVNEAISIQASGEKSKKKDVQVIYWTGMGKAKVEGTVLGLAVSAPRIALLTHMYLYIAYAGNFDETPPLAKLDFKPKTTIPAIPKMNLVWLAVTAVDERFVCLGIDMNTATCVIVPFTNEGSYELHLTLPPEINPVAGGRRPVFDFVGFGGRAYFVVEGPRTFGSLRYAYSVGFDGNKANLREEPLLARLNGYRLASFDDALYALNRQSGQMFRFDLDRELKLGQPKKAASAVTQRGGAEQSMVAEGLLVPMGRLLVVLSPTAVPSVDSLRQFGLQNTLRYAGTSSTADSIPQDLIYNPQKDYWARCGHDLDLKHDRNREPFAAFRGGESMRLWVIQPDYDLQTLAVGAETLFAPDYVFEFPTKPLPPYLNKKRQLKITNKTGMPFVPISETYRKLGLTDFSSRGPAELTSELPDTFRPGSTETFEFKYNDTDSVSPKLRFLVERKKGVKHDYLLELTFSGPDLSTATSVFKRLATSATKEVTIAEIPGTEVQHSTNNPILIPPPKLLVEGVKFRAQNATTYQLWQEAPQAGISGRYLGEEIRITYDTPAFYLLAFGAGELHVDVDFSLPLGIEVSSGSQPQSKMIRINTDKSTGLHAGSLSTTSPTFFQCKLSYLREQPLDGVHIGDGVASERGEAIYLPLGEPSFHNIPRVFKINPEDLSATQSTPIIPRFGGDEVFSMPNSIALSSEYVFAIFRELELHVLDYSLQMKDKVSVREYNAVTGIKCYYENNYVVVGVKNDESKAHYILGKKFVSRSTTDKSKITFGNIADISLDDVKGFREQNRVPGSPAWVSAKTVSPMAISPSPVSPGGEQVREVAVCIDGGLFVVGRSDKTIRTLALESAFREEDIAFGREGKHIYCLHSESDNLGLRVSRVDNKTWKQTHSLPLRSGEKAADLATDTRQSKPGINRNQRSISMVLDLDDKLLFVSHGTFIFKVDATAMKLLDTYQTELPCRVLHVWRGKPSADSHPVYGSPTSCTLLYAIGASYRGDGNTAQEFKTHLYKLGIPD